MKRYAQLYNNQLIFNFTKNDLKWKFVPQKNREDETVKSFEKKYNVKFEWREEKTKRNDGSELSYWGYFLIK